MPHQDPVTAAWQFVADNLHHIEKKASKWCPKWLEPMEFQNMVADDVFDAHCRGLYRPGASAPGTWIYTRARLKCTEAIRQERRRRLEVSLTTGPDDRSAGAFMAGASHLVDNRQSQSRQHPLSPSWSWGSLEAVVARTTLASLIQGASETEKAACYSFLADHNAKACRQKTGLSLKQRNLCLRQMGARLENQCRP